MKTIVILMLLISLGACKKSKDSGSSKNPTPPPNNPTPEEPTEPLIPPPTINEITSVQKIYGSGSEVEFVVTFSKAIEVSEVEFVVMFSKAVEVSQAPFLSLNVGGETRQAHFRRGAGESGKDISFFYEVQSNDNDDDGIALASNEINLNGGSIQDTSGQDLVNTIPQKYQNFPDVKVDTIFPMIESIAKASGSSSGGIVDFVVTFNEPVKVKGVPALTLSLVGSTARATYEDTGGTTYSPTQTFRYTIGDGQSGSVQLTGIELDQSNGISDEAGNQVGDNISSPLHIRGVNIQASGTCSNAADSSGFNGGDGSASAPYLICTYTQLNKMRDSLTAHYELGQNINADESWGVGADGCTNYDGSTVPETTPCTGWVSVGAYDLNRCDGETDDICFQGHLDGGGYVISNLYVNVSGSVTKYGGFFGYTGSQAEISHISLTNASVTVTTSALYSYGGGLVGYNVGTISNSYAIGEVVSSATSRSYGGGLVGYNSNSGTISNSYATGNAFSSSIQSYSGGLVGRNAGTVSNSYATGEVTSSSGSKSYGGGLVGYNYQGTVSNSYATGEVTSSASASASYSYGGGLVGYNHEGTVSNSYATGEVISSGSNSYGGGLVGYNRSQSTIKNSYATGEVASSSASYSYGGGLVGRNAGTISNSYTTGTPSAVSTSGDTYGGGLVGFSSGTISGTNYFVDSSGTNGLGSGTCSGTCTQKTLAQLQALTSVTDWSTDDWGFGTTTQLPRVKYAPTATYCTDDTHTTQQACEDASESWVIEGCGGDTGVTCGDVIPGQ